MFNLQEEKLNEEELDFFEPEPDVDEPNFEKAHTARRELALSMLEHVHESLGHVIDLLKDGDSAEATRRMVDLVTTKKKLAGVAEDLSGAQVIEGFFDGVSMVGSDKKIYSVPVNYASKSRLVEGDVLKLTIKSDGSFIYKQINPVDRRRLVGVLAYDPTMDEHVVTSEDGVYKVLTASVTFFKGLPGDEVIILVPGSGKCTWAAVEHISR